MGIEGLSKLLLEKASSAVKEVSLEEFRGSFIPVDVSSYLYQFAFNSESKGKGSYLRGFFEMIVTFHKYQIRPIFVFEGHASSAKSKTLAARRDATNDKYVRINELSQDIVSILGLNPVPESTMSQTLTLEELLTANPTIRPTSEQLAQISAKQAEIAKHQKNIIHISREMIDNLKQLFTLCNTPHLQARGEADFMCVKLCKMGYGAAVCSEDLDILTHGANLIRGINGQLFRTKSLVLFYHLPTVLTSLKMTQEEFTDMCILCGCDYCQSPRGIGPKTAYSLINEHRTIEKIQATNKKFNMNEDSFTFKLARKEFQKSEDETPTIDLTEFKLGNRSEISKYLLKQTNYTDKTLQRKLDELCCVSPRDEPDKTLRNSKGATTISVAKPKLTITKKQ